MKLNLGCGNDLQEGWIGIDNGQYCNYKNKKIIKSDLNKELPIKDNTVEMLKCNHVFEHIINLEGLMKEIYRICKNGCKMEFSVPHFTSNSFEFHIRQGFRYNMFNCYKFFDKVERKLVFKGMYKFMNFLNKSKFLIRIYEGSFLRNLFFCSEVIFEAEMRKV